MTAVPVAPPLQAGLVAFGAALPTDIGLPGGLLAYRRPGCCS
ncbi:MAG: hypothetical protein NT132_03585 [Microbacterium sp.]|nr:hypothetical protein [Microbacterium sp.]MCX6501479.1 hypothetical protein [Microbacterium sp.]